MSAANSEKTANQLVPEKRKKERKKERKSQVIFMHDILLRSNRISFSDISNFKPLPKGSTKYMKKSSILLALVLY